MGQVAHSMNPSQDNMCDDVLLNSDTSTISSGENSSTHSPDSTSNTMLMDKYTHITSTDNFMDSLPRYHGDKQLLMDSTGNDDDDVCLQSVPGDDGGSGNIPKESWDEYRPGLLHYPGLHSNMLSPLPGIFHSIQLRNPDAQPLSTTTTTASQSQYDISFDSDKNEDTVRAIHVAIDELAAMMNAHSLLSKHTNNYAEEELVEHPDEENMTTTTTSASSLMDSGISKFSTTSSPNNTTILSTEHVSPSQVLDTPAMDQTSRRTTTTSTTLPAGFQFSFASSNNPAQEPTACNDHRTNTKEPHQPTITHQRKILPLPKPRVQRTQPQQLTLMSSEFTFKPPYNPSTHSKAGKEDYIGSNVFTTSTSHSYDMDHQILKDEKSSQDYTKKAKRSGDYYTDDEDDEDGGCGDGMIYRTYNRYSNNNKPMGTSSTATRSLVVPSKYDGDTPFDPPQDPLLPPSLLRNSFLQPLPTVSNVSSPAPQNLPSKPPPPIPASISSSLSPPPHNKKNSQHKSGTPASSPYTDSIRRDSNSTRTDTNRNTRGKQPQQQQQQHGKQLVSPSSSASNSRMNPASSRRKGKHGQVEDTQYQYHAGSGSSSSRKNDNGLDLVTSTLRGPDDWICLFCQYEIFKKGWFTAKRKQLVQEQRKRMIQKRLEHRLTQQQQQHANHSMEQQQQQQQQKQHKDNGLNGSKTRPHRVTQLDANPVT